MFRHMIKPTRSRPRCWLSSWNKRASPCCLFPSPELLPGLDAIDRTQPERRALHLGVASLCVRTGASHVQTDPGTVSKTQGGGLRVGIQWRYRQGHGPFRPNSTGSLVHQPGGGHGLYSGTCSSQAGTGADSFPAQGDSPEAGGAVLVRLTLAVLRAYLPLFASGKNAATRSLSVNSIPRPGYCLTTFARISAAFFDARRSRPNRRCTSS